MKKNSEKGTLKKIRKRNKKKKIALGSGIEIVDTITRSINEHMFKIMLAALQQSFIHNFSFAFLFHSSTRCHKFFLMLLL